MLFTRATQKTGIVFASWIVLLVGSSAVRAGDCDSCETSWWERCPPYLTHLFEGPPKICFKQACPKPLCCPSNMEYYGYYPTCWHRWPWEIDVSRCQTPVDGIAVPSTLPPAKPEIVPTPPLLQRMPRDSWSDKYHD